MPPLVSTDRLGDLVRFAACPACRAALQRQPTALTCSSCERSYPLVDGRPVFLDDPTTVKVMPAGHLSNQPPPAVAAWLRGLDGWALNVGAGGTGEKIGNVIELEYSLFRNTDVSADAHYLPFRDAAFDAVVTFNTFEHLYDPARAAREIFRVLKPGGRVFLHTAFLQPVHEPPHHYYNATEYGVRQWFKGFDIKGVGVSSNFQPGYVLAWLSCEILAAVKHHLGEEAHRLLARSSLETWALHWADATKRGPVWEVLRCLPPGVQSRFAAGFELDARKPSAGSPTEQACSSASHELQIDKPSDPVPAAAAPRLRAGRWLKNIVKHLLRRTGQRRTPA
jgi:SAM-dependent methyltransferase/uncharacterized protein YbaR (Trm112 family)